MQLFGLNTFKFLFSLFGFPSTIVYDFHTYELGRTPSYNELKLIPKLGYYRAQRTYSKPALVFEEFVKYILAKGYRSKYMVDVYEGMKPGLPSWRWDRD
jgi:hypothetical protein